MPKTKRKHSHVGPFKKMLKTAFKIWSVAYAVESKTKKKPGKTGPSSVYPTKTSGKRKRTTKKSGKRKRKTRKR